MQSRRTNQVRFVEKLSFRSSDAAKNLGSSQSNWCADESQTTNMSNARIPHILQLKALLRRENRLGGKNRQMAVPGKKTAVPSVEESGKSKAEADGCKKEICKDKLLEAICTDQSRDHGDSPLLVWLSAAGMILLQLARDAACVDMQFLFLRTLLVGRKGFW
jgi:hypothetical protein